MEVDVVILTYNHESFIAKALDSVLMQQTNFDFRIIIADDGSKDDTANIIEKYKNKHPKKIEFINNNKNQGVLKNVFSLLTKDASKYIAFLDGDDYWTYNLKLQKQYNFLEANKEYSGCFHNTEIIQEKNASEILFNSFSSYAEVYNYRKEVYPWDLTNRLILPTSSLFIESKFLDDESFKLINDNYSIAWKIMCLAIKYKKFYYFKENWSVYLNHMQGVSKSETINFHQSHIVFLKALLKDDYYKNIPFEIWQSTASEYYILINKLKGDGINTIPIKLKLDYTLSELYKIYHFFKKIKK